MQRMHQSYKYMKAQRKELSGCASNSLAHEDLGHLRKPIVGIYKQISIMKNSHQYMKVTKQETLYHEDYGATLKHKCGKGQQHCPFSLFLSYFFIWAFSPFLWPLFFRPESHPDLWGNHSLHHPFLTWDNALENDDHHTSIYLQLNDYNSILEQSMTLYECLRWCTGMCNDS